MNSDEPLTFHHVFIIISLCLSIAALFIERDLSLRIHEMFVTSTLKFGLLFPVVLIGDLEGTIYVGNSLCTSIGREKKKKHVILHRLQDYCFMGYWRSVYSVM